MTEASEDIESLVLSHLLDAALAIREQDIDRVVRCLESAVMVYEKYPSFVHGPESQLRDLLVCIRSSRSICVTLGLNDDDFHRLEDRAEALRLAEFH